MEKLSTRKSWNLCIVLGISLFALCVFAPTSLVYATTISDLAKNTGTEILKAVAWIVLVAGLIGVGTAVVKRNFTAAIITFITTAVVFVVMQNPTYIETVGNMFKSVLGI